MLIFARINLIIILWDSRSKEACSARGGGGVENFWMPIASVNLRFTMDLEVDDCRLKCTQKKEKQGHL
jgi:hypothetical protein